MFEAVGVTVSRLIRTRFGDIVLPRNLRRGRWEELDGSLVTALMVQLGLLRDGDESEGRRKSRQPQSHDSALPPGFGTLERNGMNGARIGRRGKLQGGRPGSAAACPSDPFGTGLMITGGYANGHPLGNDSAAGRGGKGKPAKGKAGGDKPQRGQGRKAAGAQAGGQGAAAKPAGARGGRRRAAARRLAPRVRVAAPAATRQPARAARRPAWPSRPRPRAIAVRPHPSRNARVAAAAVPAVVAVVAVVAVAGATTGSPVCRRPRVPSRVHGRAGRARTLMRGATKIGCVPLIRKLPTYQANFRFIW